MRLPEKGDRPTGLEFRANKDGTVRCYWRADRAAVKKGFPSPIVRLAGDWSVPEDRARIIDNCARLQSDLSAFLDETPREAASVGTIAWLCDLYQTHPQSPYTRKRHDTQFFYDKSIKVLKATVGARRAGAVDGPTVWQWFENWGAPAPDSDKPRPRRAKACIQTLRVIAKFGASCKSADARELRAILADMQFPGTPKRKSAMTREQCEAICKAARALGWPSLARGVAVQFWTALRQKDVIGEWVRPEKAAKAKVWQNGLVWGEHVSRSLQLVKPTSKSNGKVEVDLDLTLIPAVVEQFDDVPIEAREGPVIIAESTGRPYTRQLYGTRFREAAANAGVPADVWNMDSRAGAVTEALAAGAAPTDVMKAAGHTQLQTTMGYHRGVAEQAGRVARLRVAARKAGGE